MDYEKKAEEALYKKFPDLVPNEVQPHHWLKLLRDETPGDWMLKSTTTGYEIVDMMGYGTRGFLNTYMIVGHEKFYQRVCEQLEAYDKLGATLDKAKS